MTIFVLVDLRPSATTISNQQGAIRALTFLWQNRDVVMAASSVSSSNIVDSTIATGDLANSSVTSAKLDLTMAPMWTGSHAYTNTGSTMDVINVTGSSLTTGSAMEMTGPSGGTAGVTTSV